MEEMGWDGVLVVTGSHPHIFFGSLCFFSCFIIIYFVNYSLGDDDDDADGGNDGDTETG
jgi:hypothetical protein